MARVLVAKPKILILDEATANIDSGTEALIQRSLHALRHDMTLVVIAHRLSTIMEADKIVVLHHGELGRTRLTSRITGSKGRYAQMYKMQQVGEHLRDIEHQTPLEPVC
ncbi:hypothetical protein ACT691_08680 [Vibrio metschnikovii]